FTIEPGIYLPGRFGVRLESDVAIGLNGEVNVLDMYWPY
ncbi:MAG: aminopeptidase P family protein, partial [Caldivirga sp.]|nr:aminopeptidase P family protein [Caldivirga sp.]